MKIHFKIETMHSNVHKSIYRMGLNVNPPNLYIYATPEFHCHLLTRAQCLHARTRLRLESADTAGERIGEWKWCGVVIARGNVKQGEIINVSE